MEAPPAGTPPGGADWSGRFGPSPCRDLTIALSASSLAVRVPARSELVAAVEGRVEADAPPAVILGFFNVFCLRARNGLRLCLRFTWRGSLVRISARAPGKS